MARTQIANQQLPLAGATPGVFGASYFPSLPITATCADLTWTTADVSNMNYATIVSGKTLLLVKNVHTTTGFSLTIHSVADSQQRSGDISAYNVTALTTSCFGPFVTNPSGWNQTSPAGLWFDGASTNLLFAVMTLP